MVYIRIKQVSNKPYAYLVENISTENGPRQKVRKYLGRVYHFEKQQEIKSNFNAENKLEFLKQLISHHLLGCGFAQKEKSLINNKVNFSLTDLQFESGVVSINDGFLCNHTIGQLLEFQKTSDLKNDAQQLAKYFITAGLPLSPPEFVQFYQLL